MPYYALTCDGSPVGWRYVEVEAGDPGVLDWCPDGGPAPPETVSYERATRPDDSTPGESLVYSYACKTGSVHEY